MSFETSMKCFIRRFSTVEESHFSSHVSRHSWYSTVRERDAHRLNLRSRLANRKLVLCICSRIDCFDIYAKHLLRYVSTDGVEQTALPDTRSLFLLVRHQINITIRPMVVNSLWRHTILITTFVFFFFFSWLLFVSTSFFTEPMWRIFHWTRWSPLAGGNRPFQRSVYLLVIWTCLCYGLFQISSRGSVDSSSNGGYAGAGPVNSRLLLQKVTETPTSTAASNGVATGTQPSSGSTDSVAVKVDRQKSPDDDELAPFIQRRIPNVPFEYWLKEKSKIYGKNHTCAFYPSVFDIKFNNE